MGNATTWTRALALLRRALPDDADLQIIQAADGGPAARVAYGDIAPILIVLTDRPNEGGKKEGGLPVRVLPAGSPEERDRLRRAGQSYIDLAGAVHLRAPGFYLDRSDLPAAPSPTQSQRGINPYTDAASRVARVLLAAPRSRRWSTRGLSDAADVHPSTASRVIQELTRRELVQDERPGERRRSRIWLPEAEALIEDWTRSYRWKDNRQLRVAAPVGSPRRFLERMPQLLSDNRWALTLQAGASTIAPHAQFDVIHFYVGSSTPLEDLALHQGWKISPSGKLCLLEPVYDESVWFQEQTADGLPVVSSVQLVIDLWHYPVRGREQAQHLIDTKLRPIWGADNE